MKPRDTTNKMKPGDIITYWWEIVGLPFLCNGAGYLVIGWDALNKVDKSNHIFVANGHTWIEIDTKGYIINKQNKLHNDWYVNPLQLYLLGFSDGI